ncbi:MAG: hypothetical protein HY902_15480 [Deltaproteobacteria bacterium]|nr:hypothetical protein [Deltaproteobacteria bacterium]
MNAVYQQLARGISTFVVLAAALACSSPAATPASTSDVAAADTSTADTAKSDAADTLAGPTWLDSLNVCWTDMGCPRAFVISHGGDWTLGKGRPYDSKAAFERAFQLGADGIKTDFLVTKDKVAVVAHSSPILAWESAVCQGKKIEEMTADEVTACPLFDSPTTTQTYQRVDEVIEWARGKGTLMLTVKNSAEFGSAIELILARKAQDFVHIETHMGDLALIKKLPNWDKVRYTVQVGSLQEVEALLGEKPVLFCEMDPSYPELDAAGLGQLIATKVHPAGMRAFVSSQKLPSVEQHKALWNGGFDVIMTYNLAAAMEARKAVNEARGITPP